MFQAHVLSVSFPCSALKGLRLFIVEITGGIPGLFGSFPNVGSILVPLKEHTRCQGLSCQQERNMECGALRDLLRIALLISNLLRAVLQDSHLLCSLLMREAEQRT